MGLHGQLLVLCGLSRLWIPSLPLVMTPCNVPGAGKMSKASREAWTASEIQKKHAGAAEGTSSRPANQTGSPLCAARDVASSLRGQAGAASTSETGRKVQ